MGDDKRAWVAVFAQSALFGTGGTKSARHEYTDKVMAHLPDAVIKYSGVELRDDDQDVLMALIHLGRGRPYDEKDGLFLELSGLELLKELEWPSTANYYDKLRECLNRMQKGTVMIVRRGDKGRATREQLQVVRKFTEAADPSSQRWPVWRIGIEPEMIGNFTDDARRMELTWKDRRCLRKPTAKWLHSFVCGVCPDSDALFLYDEEGLFRLSNSRAKTLNSFRDTLKESLHEMTNKSVIADWKFFEGMLFISRRPGHNISKEEMIEARRSFAFTPLPLLENYTIEIPK